MAIVTRPTLRVNPRTGQPIFDQRIDGKATPAKTGIGTATSGLDSMPWNNQQRNNWNSAENAKNDPTRAMPPAPGAVPAANSAAPAPAVAPQAAEPADPRTMARPATPFFDAAQASPLGMRAAPISIEGFKDGGPVAQNQHFLANEVGPEAFYNLATEQLEPLGNGQPGVYATRAPGVVIPAAAMPQAPSLPVPAAPAIEPIAPVVATKQADEPYILGQATAPSTLPPAPVIAAQATRPALPAGLLNPSDGVLEIAPGSPYTRPGSQNFSVGAANAYNLPNSSQPSAMPAAPSEYTPEQVAQNRQNVMQRYDTLREGQRTGQDLNEVFAGPKPMAMAEMVPQEDERSRREYQKYLNTPEGRNAYNTAKAKEQAESVQFARQKELARLNQEAIAERAAAAREQSLKIAQEKMADSERRAAEKIAVTLDEAANKKAEKQQQEVRELRDAHTIAMNLAKDFESDGDKDTAGAIITAIGKLNTPQALTAEVKYYRDQRDAKRKEQIDATKTAATQQAKAAEPAFTPAQSEKAALELAMLQTDPEKWDKLPPEEKDRIKQMQAYHAKNAASVIQAAAPAPAPTVAAAAPQNITGRALAAAQKLKQ